MSEGLCDTAGMPRPPRPLRVLHLEDSELDHDLAMALLRRNGLAIETVRVDTRHDFEAALDQPWDAIVSDFNLPGFSGLQALDIVRARDRIVPFILVSGEIGEDTAVAAMRSGASDYLLKNRLARLAPALEHAIQAARTTRAKAEADRELVASRQRLAELAGHLQTQVEAERAAIAREIHDDVGGSLTALKFDIDWIRRHSSDPTVQQRAVSALETVSHAIGASQRVMHNLRPAILEQGLSLKRHRDPACAARLGAGSRNAAPRAFRRSTAAPRAIRCRGCARRSPAGRRRANSNRSSSAKKPRKESSDSYTAPSWLMPRVP